MYLVIRHNVSDKWCSQRNRMSVATNENQVTFAKTFANSEYSLACTRLAAATTTSNSATWFTRGLTASGFQFYCTASTSIAWQANGYLP